MGTLEDKHVVIVGDVTHSRVFRSNVLLLLKLGAWPLRLLPSPPLTPDAIDFINQPATVDVAPLLARMPRRLTPLEEGLRSYLEPGNDVTLAFDGSEARQDARTAP